MCRLSIAINAVVDVKWNHVVGISVREGKECWWWNAVVADRGAQSPTVSIIAIDVLRLLGLRHLYKSVRGGVVVEVNSPCHALVHQFGRRRRGRGDALLVQIR